MIKNLFICRCQCELFLAQSIPFFGLVLLIQPLIWIDQKSIQNKQKNIRKKDNVNVDFGIEILYRKRLKPAFGSSKFKQLADIFSYLFM